MRKIPGFIISCLLLVLLSCSGVHENKENTTVNWQDEVIYHVMQRSFYDSSGDRHGDLKGITEKLDYLEELGVTAILFTPLYKSDFYHNYFPVDYEKIDPRYGSMDDYFEFIEAVHDRGMKFIMDMETQYVQNGNLWFEDSYMNPESQYSDFIYYDDEDNRYPEQFLRPSGFELYTYKAWPEQKLHIFHLDMNHPVVLEWMKDYYAFWTDPLSDGSLRYGVDGFRIDHIMDDLDYKGIFTGLYEDFWKPVFEHVRQINPGLFIVGEQSNWADYGDTMIEKSGADASFGFLIRYAIADLLAEDPPDYALGHDASNISLHIKETIGRIPDDRYFVHFIENHDIDRWSAVVGGHEGKIRCGAALTLLLPGIPAIYYGQELGVTGQVQDWSYDVNHIPVREAFPWTDDHNDDGIAVFYRDTGPWWDMSYFKTGDAESFALSAQMDDPGSLWNMYREIIALRKNSGALKHGDFRMLPESGNGLFAFAREYMQERLLVYINLSDESARIEMPRAETLFTENSRTDGSTLSIGPYGFAVLKD